MRPLRPMPKFVTDFGSIGRPAESDGRLHAPAFERNHDAIWSTMAPSLREKSGDVLELGSGTGQHIVDFARATPQLVWWPSDVVPSHLTSIEAWRQHAKLANLRAPQRIDLGNAGWTWRVNGEAGGKLAAMICINVLHIAPWSVSQNLLTGAGRFLRADGRLFVYGPFMRNGTHTAPSNAAFDASLRAENPDWGVRDVADLAATAEKAGLTLAETFEMPANNLVLAFARALGQN